LLGEKSAHTEARHGGGEEFLKGIPTVWKKGKKGPALQCKISPTNPREEKKSRAAKGPKKKELFGQRGGNCQGEGAPKKKPPPNRVKRGPTQEKGRGSSSALKER